MAAKKNPPVRVPPKLGTQGPASGPTGETVVDAEAHSALDPGVNAPKATKAQKAAQKTAENAKGERSVKVRVNAKGPGYLGDRLRNEGDVFVLHLAAGQTLPSWADAVDPKDASTPPTHSAEAQEEFVAADGTGKKIDGNDVL